MPTAMRTRPNTVIQSLLQSEDVRDERKALDIQYLDSLSKGQWRERFEVIDFAHAQARALAVICLLRTAGLVWAGNGPARQDAFVFALVLPHTYPLSPPTVRFLKTVPWCCHVVHESFLPEAADLPPDLQAYLREGHGHCCFMKGNEWTSDVAVNNLATVVRQVSRIVSLATWHGELNSLNPTALDHAQRMRKRGELPLGPALPYPREDGGQDAAGDGAAPDGDGVEEEAVEWLEG